jgi:DNA-binding response OmpR family regulator
MPKSSQLILLVEDRPELREVITDFLSATFQVETASNYDDGIVLLNASSPSLLIANVLIPGSGDGLRLAEAAHRLGVPTLLISGHPEVIAKHEELELPFLSKPFRLSELQRVIRTLIDAKLATAELTQAKLHLP